MYAIQDGPVESVNIIRVEKNKAVEICSILKRPGCKISAWDIADILIGEMNRLYEAGEASA